jgi:hypothetical protein
MCWLLEYVSESIDDLDDGVGDITVHVVSILMLNGVVPSSVLFVATLGISGLFGSSFMLGLLLFDACPITPTALKMEFLMV